MEENSELLTKYQKLAHEYSKLKAQTSVLKTAVAEEQSASSELQETLKKKDQLIRKLEQEVECLNFRNLQLTKRVSILQNDLEGIDTNPKHSKSKHGSNQSAPLAASYGVLNVELQSRIEENEKLHKQVYAADIEHRKEVAELSSTVEKLQNDLADQDRKLNEKIQEQDTLINTLQKEKIKMQITLKNYEKEVKNHKKEEEIKEKDNTSLQEDLQVQLEEAKAIIADKILFNDTYVDALNKLNAPVLQRGKHRLLCTFMTSMHTLISDFFRQLSDLFTFLIQRLCSDSASDIQEIIVRLESDLRDSISHVKTIPTNFEKITSAIKDESLAWDKSPVLGFSVAFQKYVIYLDKLMPYLILRIQNKESWMSSSPKSLELAPKLISLCRKFMNCFKTLCKYLELLQTIGTEGSKVYVIKQSVIIQKILSNAEALHLSFEEARKLFGSKVALDHQLPTMSQDEKNTDECILSTLVSLSATLKKLTDLMAKDIDMISCDTWYKPRKCSKLRNGTVDPFVWQYKNRGSQYFQLIYQPEMPSIPYEVALENNKKLRDHSDNQQNLTQQLEHYQNKLMQLELDKEKWMLECTLLKAKESKNSDSASPSDEDIKALGYDEIHQFVQTTVNQFIQQTQFADSKFIAYRNECETLYQKLKMCLQKKETLENEIATSRQIIERMKEEQKTLMHSYEDQLNTMSEHLANLNETLTAQKDEIDALKQAGGKVPKKGKLR